MEKLEQTESIWTIRLEGNGNYPRCRSSKRKTMSKFGTKESVKRFAKELEYYGGYTIVWIKDKDGKKL